MPDHAGVCGFLGVTVQVCFCGEHVHGVPGVLPVEPLTEHSYGCVIWDWAMLTGRITPSERMRQLDEYELGFAAGQ